MAIDFPVLPYSMGALAPFISERTLEFHYGKHHRAYVDNANRLLAGTDMEELSPEEIILRSAKDPSKTGIYNNVAQAWNHDFYWKCLKANGGGQPTGDIAGKILDTWGNFEKFFQELHQTGMAQFGSGWVWLVLEQGTLKITRTANADNPLIFQQKPLLTIDVWEHAYYLDYQNRRADYLTTVIEKLINWEFVSKNFSG